MASALAWSVGLCLAAGAVHFLIGALTPFFGFPPGIVGLSARTDQQAWNRTSAELLQDPVVRDLRTHHHIMLGGLLVFLGLAEMALAWTGLRAGAPVALYALSLAWAGSLAYWIAMVMQFVRLGAHPTLWDLQPFVWVPTLLLAPGLVLGWVALRPWA